MTLEMWLIAFVRVGGSLPVLRWPFYGAIAAILIDLSDLFMMNLLDLGGVRDYQTFDKALDQVYMGAFLIVAWRWGGVERNVALALYGLRMVGFVAFELSESRNVLMLFPNLFEFWFVFCAARRQFGLEDRVPLSLKVPVRGRLTLGTKESWNAPLILGGLALVLAKLAQEYAIHYGRWLDNVTAVDAVESIWRFVTPF